VIRAKAPAGRETHPGLTLPELSLALLPSSALSLGRQTPEILHLPLASVPGQSQRGALSSLSAPGASGMTQNGIPAGSRITCQECTCWIRPAPSSSSLAISDLACPAGTGTLSAGRNGLVIGAFGRDRAAEEGRGSWLSTSARRCSLMASADARAQRGV
jgi:hypothetical protein